MLWSEPQLRKHIPLGVRILAILNLIFGFAALLNLIYLLIGGVYVSIFSPTDSSTETIVINTLIAILCLIVGFGFYMAKRWSWSWTLAVVLYSINMGAIIFRTVVGLDSVGELIRLGNRCLLSVYVTCKGILWQEQEGGLWV